MKRSKKHTGKVVSKAKGSYYERFMSMTDARRDAEVARFDKDTVGTPGRPLTSRDKALHRRARRGRPVVGKGAKRVLVTIERELLDRTDALARHQGLSRAQIVARGLQRELAPSAWGLLPASLALPPIRL